MAIITEEQQDPNPHPPPPQTNPFTFWFYFTLTSSLITLLFISLSSFLTPQDPKAWFLTLPSTLRTHYTQGRTIKIQLTPNHPSIELFTYQNGPTKSDTNLLIIHGLGCTSFTFRHIVNSLGQKGIRAIAIDLPGSGFSDKSEVVFEVENFGGVFGFYREIKEKGLFWGFDQLIEKGYVNYEDDGGVGGGAEIKKEGVRGIELGGEEMGRVLGQVVDSLGLENVDLVLHDVAIGLGANWVFENSGLVRSVTLLNAGGKSAMPLWVLDLPVVREVVLGFGFVFERVVGWCCGGGGLDGEAHRVLLKGRDGRRSVVGMGKKVNGSLDLGEWSGLEGVKDLPVQVIWSKEWLGKEGGGVAAADAIPRANFVTHSGGRWPQEDTSDEIAESIYEFVSSLPKPIRQVQEEPVPDHIQKIIDEAKDSHDHHHHDGHSHNHDHAAGYMDAYGLDHGWGA